MRAGTEIDRVAYDGGPAFPNPDGAAMELIRPDLDNALGANWRTRARSLARQRRRPRLTRYRQSRHNPHRHGHGDCDRDTDRYAFTDEHAT